MSLSTFSLRHAKTSSVVTVAAPQTCVAHELPRDLLVAAAAAEDLAAQSAVVATSERGELLIAVVALLALAVRHPVLLQITVLRGETTQKPAASQTSRWHNLCFSFYINSQQLNLATNCNYKVCHQ